MRVCAILFLAAKVLQFHFWLNIFNGVEFGNK